MSSFFTFGSNAFLKSFSLFETFPSCHRLTLLYSTILFLSHEAFRKTCLNPDTIAKWRSNVNILWLWWEPSRRVISSVQHFFSGVTVTWILSIVLLFHQRTRGKRVLPNIRLDVDVPPSATVGRSHPELRACRRPDMRCVFRWEARRAIVCCSTGSPLRSHKGESLTSVKFWQNPGL
jgi:hypothetical protein